MKPKPIRSKHQPLKTAYAILEAKRKQLGDDEFKRLLQAIGLDIAEKKVKSSKL